LKICINVYWYKLMITENRSLNQFGRVASWLQLKSKLDATRNDANRRRSLSMISGSHAKYWLTCRIDEFSLSRLQDNDNGTKVSTWISWSIDRARMCFAKSEQSLRWAYLWYRIHFNTIYYTLTISISLIHYTLREKYIKF